MNVPLEIEKYAADADKPALLWLFERYHTSGWRFVARCAHRRYGTQSYQTHRIWTPTNEGRILWMHAQAARGAVSHCPNFTNGPLEEHADKGVDDPLARLVRDCVTNHTPEQLAAGWLRYEALRRMHPHAFADLHRRTLCGERFDDLVTDALLAWKFDMPDQDRPERKDDQ